MDPSVRRSDAFFATQLTDHQEAIKDLQKASKTASQEISENNTEASQKLLEEESKDTAAMGAKIPNRRLSAPRTEKVDRAKEVQESVLVRKDEADEMAGNFSKRQGNREYKMDAGQLSQLAQDLGVSITPRMSSDEIIRHVQNRLRATDPKTGKPMPIDVSQVDKAFEFLIFVLDQQKAKAKEDSPESNRLTEIASHVQLAKNDHYNQNASAIDMARKIIGVAGGMAEGTGASVKETLDTLRGIINNPQDVQAKRKFYKQNGGYDTALKEAKDLYHYIGINLKRANVQIEGDSKKKEMPVLESAEMAILNNETKVLQALTWVLLNAKVQVKHMSKMRMLS